MAAIVHPSLLRTYNIVDHKKIVRSAKWNQIHGYQRNSNSGRYGAPLPLEDIQHRGPQEERAVGEVEPDPRLPADLQQWPL